MINKRIAAIALGASALSAALAKNIFHDSRVHFHEAEKSDEDFLKYCDMLAKNPVFPAGLNLPLANEGYVYVDSMLSAISNNHLGEDQTLEYKQIVGRDILLERSFSSTFLDLVAGIPLVQIDGEVAKFEEMMESVRDFIVQTGVPQEEIFAANEDGNNPLHFLAALAPKNQFEAFCSSLSQLIPANLWQQKNKNGHTPLDILNNNELQMEYMDKLSQHMNVEMHTAAKSPSDLLHSTESLDRAYCSSDVVTLTTGDNIPSFPKEAFQRNVYNYDILNLVTREVIGSIDTADYEKIEHLLLDGPSYAQTVMLDRVSKLEIAMATLNNHSPAGDLHNAKVVTQLFAANNENLRGSNEL